MYYSTRDAHGVRLCYMCSLICYVWYMYYSTRDAHGVRLRYMCSVTCYTYTPLSALPTYLSVALTMKKSFIRVSDKGLADR